MSGRLNNRLRKLDRELSQIEKERFTKSGKAQDLFTALGYMSKLERLSGLVYRGRYQKNPQQSDYEDMLTQHFAHLRLCQEQRRQDQRYQRFVTNYRQIWRQHLSLFLISFAIFASTLVLGFYLATMRPEYVQVLFPQSFQEIVVEHTKWYNGIREDVVINGFFIAVNNIKVAANTFIGGCLFGIGALLLLFYNGVQIGAVVGYCFSQNFHEPLVGFIISHGFLELTIIMAAAFAGLVIGRGFYAGRPSQWSKTVAQSGRQGFTLLIGILPWLLLAAFFEVVVSPFDYFSFPQKLAGGIFIGLLFWVWTFWPIKQFKGDDW